MKLSIAGQDKTKDLGRELHQQAEAMERVAASRKLAPFPPEISAQALSQAQSEAEYLDRLISLVGCRNAIDTLDFAIPRKPGIAGLCMAKFKTLLWKLLRYQHDRVAFRQNLINMQLTSALAFEFAQRQKETADLKRRVAELEKQGGGNLR